VIWMTWRQHRAEALATTGVIAVLIAVFLVLGHDLHTAFRQDRLGGCLNYGRLCDPSAFLNRGSVTMYGLIPFLNLLPALIGAFVFAPLMAREAEQGTWRLAWTQGTPRRRWLAVKLAVTLPAAVVLTALFSVAFTWYHQPIDRLKGPFDSDAFNFEGLSLPTLTLFAAGFGLLAGVLLRRTVLAALLTLVATLLARPLVQNGLRPHYEAPVTGSHTTGFQDWVLSATTLDSHGHRLSRAAAQQLALRAQTSGGDSERWLLDHGYHQAVSYQPGNRYWTFQLIEGGIFTLAAAVLIGLAAWQLRRRFR
jgi:hypothetical protein